MRNSYFIFKYINLLQTSLISFILALQRREWLISTSVNIDRQYLCFKFSSIYDKYLKQTFRCQLEISINKILRS